MGPGRDIAGEPVRLTLKVDIDTLVGWREGAPRLGELFERRGIKASFYASMGPDHSGRALARVVKPGFIRKQLKSGAAGAYGVTTMLYGWALPGPIIAAAAPQVFKQLLERGHEVGLHGWDHVFWHDRLVGLSRERIRLHLGRAWRSYRDIVGSAPHTFASPGWQINPLAYAQLTAMGMTHVSCARGGHAFRPLFKGRALPIVELPTTMPTMDEVLGHDGVGCNEVAGALAAWVRPGRLNVFTLHGEVEGREFLGPFAEMLSRLQDRGVVFETLLEAANRLAEFTIPVEEVSWGLARGRAGRVACQASHLGRAEVLPC